MSVNAPEASGARSGCAAASGGAVSPTGIPLESEVYFKLQEAEKEAELTDQRYSSKDVLKAMKAAIGEEQVV